MSTETRLSAMRERFTYATEGWREIRAEGHTDMRYVAGDPWEPKDLKARRDAGRPALALDELGQFTNQLINAVRANKRAIRVSPRGNGADETTATFREDLIRQIEYESHAQDAYTCAFENAVQRSYGFVRVKAEWEGDKSLRQKLLIEPLVNPDLVTPDPDAVRPDLSDMRDCFIHDWWQRDMFAEKFPKSEAVDWTPELQSMAPAWGSEKRILLAEYWQIDTTNKTLVVVRPRPRPMGQMEPLTEPQALFLEDLDPRLRAVVQRDYEQLGTREVEVSRVRKMLTNGIELLEETDWKGKYIPVSACLGKVLYLTGDGGTEKRILSLVRLARDPVMLYNYYRTCEAEVVSRVPKVPAIGYRGQFTGFEEQWQKSVQQPMAYLEVNAITEDTGANVLALPQMQMWEPPIQALELGAEAARRAIQSAIGAMPLPTSAQRQNQKSGIALQRIEDTSARGSYHFVDHLDDMIVHTGRILNDLIPYYYDGPRQVSVRKADDTAEMIQINTPEVPESVSATTGDHEVTISTGPSYDSELEAARDFVERMMTTPAAPQVMDLLVKTQGQGPIWDQIAERVTPPEYRKQAEGQQPTPEQMQQQVAQMGQQMQQLMQAAQGMKQALDTEAAKQAATVEKAKIEAARDLEKAKIDAQRELVLQQSRNQTALAVAKVNAMARSVVAEQQAQNDQIALAADAEQAELDRAHEVAMAVLTAPPVEPEPQFPSQPEEM